MKLKTKYILFSSLIIIVLIIVALFIYPHNKYAFIAAEIIVVFAAFLFYLMYRRIFKPFKLLDAGISSISDRDFSIKFLPVGQKELDALIDVYNRMIEQLRLERAHNSEKNFFLEKLISASPAGIIILNKNGSISNINPSASHILNIGEDNKLPEDLKSMPAPWAEALSKIKESGTETLQVHGARQYKCHRSFLIDRGVKQDFFMIQEFSNELLKAEWQSYEKVIRMMAHEVNNSIGAVNSIIDSTVQFIQKQDQAEVYTEALQIAQERLGKLGSFTRRYADLVKLPDPVLAKVSVKEIFDQVLIFQQMQLKQRNISLKSEIKPDEAQILCDAGQMELVLTNILKNAMEAIGSDGFIRISFEASKRILLIENNGEAISEELQSRLFAPFFTTKSSGQGIGLTLTREVLSKHGCSYGLCSREDGITEFRIVFP